MLLAVDLACQGGDLQQQSLLLCRQVRLFIACSHGARVCSCAEAVSLRLDVNKKKK